MALDDKFFPEDGTLITKFDNFMIRQARRVGEAYQERTGKSYKDLVKNTYLHSSITSIPTTFLYPYIHGPIISTAFYLYSKSPDFSTPIEEENKLESKGSSKRYLKYSRLLFLAVSSMALINSIPDLFSSPNLSKQIDNFGVLSFGISYGFHAFGDYLSKSGLPKPPKKEAKEKAKRRFGIMLQEPSSA